MARPTGVTEDKASWDMRLQRLERCWHDRRSTAGLPGRQHIDPIDLGPALLPFVFLLEAEERPLRIRYRLAGTHMVKGIGRDPTGQLIETAFPDFMFGASYPDYVACVRDRAAIRRKGAPTSVQTRDYIVIDRILLPLATDGVTVDMILGASVYGDSRGRRL